MGGARDIYHTLVCITRNFSISTFPALLVQWLACVLPVDVIWVRVPGGALFFNFSNSTICSKWSIPGYLLEFPTSRNTYNAFFRLDMLTTGILPPFLLNLHSFCDCNTRTTVLSQRGVRIYPAEKY